MKQRILAVACGVVLGIIVAFIAPQGGERVPTSAASPSASIMSDGSAARPSIAASRAAADGAKTGGSVTGVGEKVAGDKGQPDDVQMFAIVQDLLARRDSALLYKSETELNALSVADSPVRAADNGTLQELDSVTIIRLHTGLRGVEILEAEDSANDFVNVEVTTVQEVLEMEGQAAVGPLEERCARWLLSANPWRLYDVQECAG